MITRHDAQVRAYFENEDFKDEVAANRQMQEAEDRWVDNGCSNSDNSEDFHLRQF